MAITYTTNDEVRSEAGFDNNPYITDSQIEAARIRAYGVINSKIWSRYKLPLTASDCWDTSPAKDMIRNIELMLASAYLLITEYGSEALDTDKDGYKKRELADQQLMEIMQGNIKLLCLNGDEMESNQGSAKDITVAGYPNTSEGRKFTTDMQF